MHMLETFCYGVRTFKVVQTVSGRVVCRCDSVADAQRIIAALANGVQS